MTEPDDATPPEPATDPGGEPAPELPQASEDDPDPYARRFAIEQLTGPGDEDD